MVNDMNAAFLLMSIYIEIDYSYITNLIAYVEAQWVGGLSVLCFYKETEA